jgi:hypothetical protein
MHGLDERDVLHLLDHGKDVAKAVAAETAEGILFGHDEKRGGFFAMERAQRFKVLARRFQAHIKRSDIDDRDLLFYFFFKIH